MSTTTDDTSTETGENDGFIEFHVILLTLININVPYKTASRVSGIKEARGMLRHSLGTVSNGRMPYTVVLSPMQQLYSSIESRRNVVVGKIKAFYHTGIRYSVFLL